MDKMKGSVEPIAMYYFINLLLMAPLPLSLMNILRYAAFETMIFSNVPGPKKPSKILGKDSKNMFFFVPGMGNLATGISIISHVDHFKIGIISDTSQIENPKELRDIFERNFDKILNEKKTLEGI